MGYVDIYEDEPTPGGVPTTASGLMRMGLHVLELTGDTESRRKHELKRRRIVSSDEAHKFLAVLWQQGQRSYTLVDKRPANVGLLLTVAETPPHARHTAVHAFAVTYGGLRRFLNTAVATDVAPALLDAQQRSVVREAVDASPSLAQREDYALALSTVPNLAGSTNQA